MIDKQKAFDAWAKPINAAFMPNSTKSALKATDAFEQRLKNIASTFNLDDKTVMHIRDNATKVCVSTVYNRPDVLNRIEGVLQGVGCIPEQDISFNIIEDVMEGMAKPRSNLLGSHA